MINTNADKYAVWYGIKENGYIVNQSPNRSYIERQLVKLIVRNGQPRPNGRKRPVRNYEFVVLGRIDL